MIWSTFGRRWVALPGASSAGPLLKSYFDALYVALTGDQTVAGVKTFSSNPVVSGGGIQFPGTQVPSADVNTLDDYEEGTFTPTIEGTVSAGAGTYSVQLGDYVKVGKFVFVMVNVAWSAHTGTGNMIVAGLPFTVTTQTSVFTVEPSSITLTANNYMTVLGSGSTFLLRQVPTGGGAAASVPIDTSANLRVAGWYMAPS